MGVLANARDFLSSVLLLLAIVSFSGRAAEIEITVAHRLYTTGSRSIYRVSVLSVILTCVICTTICVVVHTVYTDRRNQARLSDANVRSYERVSLPSANSGLLEEDAEPRVKINDLDSEEMEELLNDNSRLRGKLEWSSEYIAQLSGVITYLFSNTTRSLEDAWFSEVTRVMKDNARLTIAKAEMDETIARLTKEKAALEDYMSGATLAMKAMLDPNQGRHAWREHVGLPVPDVSVASVDDPTHEPSALSLAEANNLDDQAEIPLLLAAAPNNIPAAAPNDVIATAPNDFIAAAPHDVVAAALNNVVAAAPNNVVAAVPHNGVLVLPVPRRSF